MKLFNIRKIAITTAFGFAILIVGSFEVSAQSRREMERERQRIAREQRRIDRENQRANRQWQRQNRNNRNVYDGRRGGIPPVVAQGYDQGFIAGQNDRRSGKYNRSNVYRNTGAYPNEGDPSSTDYLYRQGYLQGYNDGFNGRY